MIRALFLDVDGTLVSFRTHRIAPSAVAALKEARGRGVGVFIATGRAAGDLEVLRDLPRDGVVALNGACGVLPTALRFSAAPFRARISSGPCGFPTSWISRSHSNWTRASSSIG